MDNSLLISTYIRNILSRNEELKEMLTDSVNGQLKIFPLAARTGTEYPYVVVQRNNISPSYTKDGCYENEIDITVLIVHTSYDKCVYIANIIRNILDLCRYRDNDVYIPRIELSTATEGISDEAFIQELRFSVSMAN